MALRLLTSVQVQTPGDIVALESLLNYYADAAQHVQCLATQTLAYMRFKQDLMRGIQDECPAQAEVVFLNHLLAVQYAASRVNIFAIVPTVLDVQMPEEERESDSEIEDAEDAGTCNVERRNAWCAMKKRRMH